MKHIAIIIATIALFLIPLLAQAEEAPIPPEMVEMQQETDEEENDDQNGLVVVNEKTRGECLIVWQ